MRYEKLRILLSNLYRDKPVVLEDSSPLIQWKIRQSKQIESPLRAATEDIPTSIIAKACSEGKYTLNKCNVRREKIELIQSDGYIQYF